jgi:hypothetical protein
VSEPGFVEFADYHDFEKKKPQITQITQIFFRVFRGSLSHHPFMLTRHHPETNENYCHRELLTHLTHPTHSTHLKFIHNIAKFRHPGALGLLGTYNGVGVYNGEPAFAGPSEILGIPPHHDSDHFMRFTIENG